MDCLRRLNTFVLFFIDDFKQIYLSTSLVLIALYLPVFLLSIFNHSILKISKWILTIPIVIYLLLIPTYQPVRLTPILNTCIAGLAIFYAQKVCEWILIRRNEFHQWSFFDIHHELLYYCVYTQPISIKNFNKKKKEIFFTGPIQFNKHFKSSVYTSCNIIIYSLSLDLIVYLMNQIFSTNFYEKYYENYLLIQIFINQLIGCIAYLCFMINYEIYRYGASLILNRPFELMPDLFRQPYRATSPIDFWSRWHQVFRNTWIELIFKPVSTFIRRHWPHAPKFITYGISCICVFLFSGILHEYAVYITFGKFSGGQIKFFLLQGLAVSLEYALKHRLCIPKSIGFLFTFIFNGITAGYFLQPWIPYFSRKRTFKYSFIGFIMQNLFDKY